METQLRIGNEVTDFLPKPGSLSSPSMTTLHTLFFFYLAQFCLFARETVKTRERKIQVGTL